MTQVLQNKRIISLVGYQGSGKTTIGQRVARNYSSKRVEISTLVKTLTKDSLVREELPSTYKWTEENPTWLSSYLIDLLNNYFTAKPDKNLVILSGVREQILHDELVKAGAQVFVCAIYAPPIDRYKRLVELGKVHTEEEFINHEMSEKEMGLGEVIANADYTITSHEGTSASKLASVVRQEARERKFVKRA
jgi:dephospho-CoA kinase